MDNKKLLNFLLKDLIELDELFADKRTGDFNELEMEFLQTRITGAKKLVQILSEREESQLQVPKEQEFRRETTEEVLAVNNQPSIEHLSQKKPKEEAEIELPAETPHRPKVEEVRQPEKAVPTVATEETTVYEQDADKNAEEGQKDVVEAYEEVDLDEMELEDEDPAESPNKRLSDVFLKEKSVNDTVDGGIGKLEHKLSNRPVASIQTAIGINDRFQYIRELFDGKPDEFAKTVAELDSKNNIKEAVNYLQQNFKWKKNEASLKFVNLVKRRFTND